LRDGLTGLPNRCAFEQRVAEVLEHPNFGEGSHALLTVRLSGPEGAGAGELLIAAARRLVSALRAGDLLARTGPGSFAILTRLEPGQPDARDLAERLRTVLAAPFRLSDLEAQIDCSVEYAPLLPSV
jgi:GGDEF domain-containing protein